MSRIPDKVRRLVMERAGDICELCGEQRAQELHHRRNRSQQGKHTPANLGALCSPCHLFVTVHPAAAVRNGWSIQGTQLHPDEVEVRRRGELVYLLEDGSVMPAEEEAA
jgi:5-methylcytosine-specific restriction endonuclease McrA